MPIALIVVGIVVAVDPRPRHHPVQGHVAGGRAERGADHLGLRAHADDRPASARASGSRSSPARARSCCPASRPSGGCRSTCARPSSAIDCVTHQGIPLGIRGVVIYKVGDDFASIANAARRFLDQQDQMDQRVHNVFAGHLRAIVGNMTVEEMIRDREKLTQLTRASSGVEMEKLGLIVDSLQIQEIDDPTGYIKNLGRPHAAAVAARRPHRPGPGRPEATEAEQEADALKAEARRDSVDQAGRLPGRGRPGRGQGRSRPARWPRPRPARRSSSRRPRWPSSRPQREEQRLQATVRKPADAKAYEQVTLAKAERDARIAEAEAQRQGGRAPGRGQRPAGEARGRGRGRAGAARRPRPRPSTCGSRPPPAPSRPGRSVEAEAAATEAKGLAEGEAVRAKGMAEAEAIKARADALAENQDAVIGQQLAENWPAIVEAAAKPFGGIDQLIVLNGAQGLSDALAQALSPGRGRPPAGPQPAGQERRAQRPPGQGGRRRAAGARAATPGRGLLSRSSRGSTGRSPVEPRQIAVNRRVSSFIGRRKKLASWAGLGKGSASSMSCSRARTVLKPVSRSPVGPAWRRRRSGCRSRRRRGRGHRRG